MMPLRFTQIVVEQTSIHANMTLVFQPDMSATSINQANRDIAETVLVLKGKAKVFNIFLSAHNIWEHMCNRSFQS